MGLIISEIINNNIALLEETEKTLKEVTTKAKLELPLDELPTSVSGENRKLRIVLVGQYSAGKSSILKMLTGEKDIAIGAAITTQNSKIYEWNGIEVVDTPGIATGIRPDHDAITYKAISQADLLIFVITNELFDNTIMANFKKLAYDFQSDNNRQGCSGKADEMVLVVNKMDRMGNTAENQELLKSAIRKELPDGALADMRICFIDAESYLDAMEEEDEECREELLERSGNEQFIATLNNFVLEKGLVGKLVNPVWQMQNVINKSIELLRGSAEDANSYATESVIKGAINDLKRNAKNGKRALEDVFIAAAMEVRFLGDSVASSLNSESTGIDSGFVEQKLQEISRNCNRAVEDKLEEIFADIQSDMKERFDDNFTRSLTASMAQAPNSRENQENMESIKKLQSLGHNIFKNVSKDMITEIGHLFGYKFKPWEATKYAKLAGNISQALAWAGAAIDIYYEFKEREERDRARRALAAAKADVRNTFNGIATDFEREGKNFIQSAFMPKMQDLVEEQETVLEKLLSLRAKKNEFCEVLSALNKKCKYQVETIRSEQLKSR